MTCAPSWDEVEALTSGSMGTFDCPCPACGPNRRASANRLRKVLRIWRSDPGFVSFYCARSGSSGWVRSFAAGAGQTRRPVVTVDLEAERRARAERTSFAQFLFANAGLVEGTLAERYLNSRGVGAGIDLRFSERVPFGYQSERSGPAMIAGIRNGTGGIIGCQATHLTPSAQKLRRTTFGTMVGGAVQLEPMAKDGQLAVAEGVETALAFSRLYGLPCWAALCADNMERYEPPRGVVALTIAADNDVSGRGLAAAMELARRTSRRCKAIVSAPPQIGDFNDVLLGSAA